MNIEIVDRPRITIRALKLGRPYEDTVAPNYKVRWIPVRPEVVIQDLETTLGVKRCEPDHRSTAFHLTIRMVDGDTMYLSFRPGSYRRLEWGDGESSAFQVAWDLLKCFGYRGHYVLPERGYYVLQVTDNG
jgi:hypothetical protein